MILPLNIASRRYNNIPVELVRICKCCDLNEVENEYFRQQLYQLVSISYMPLSNMPQAFIYIHPLQSEKILYYYSCIGGCLIAQNTVAEIWCYRRAIIL